MEEDKNALQTTISKDHMLLKAYEWKSVVLPIKPQRKLARKATLTVVISLLSSNLYRWKCLRMGFSFFCSHTFQSMVTAKKLHLKSKSRISVSTGWEIGFTDNQPKANCDWIQILGLCPHWKLLNDS